MHALPNRQHCDQPRVGSPFGIPIDKASCSVAQNFRKGRDLGNVIKIIGQADPLLWQKLSPWFPFALNLLHYLGDLRRLRC